MTPFVSSTLAEGLEYLERPRWRDGYLWVSDMVLRKVCILDPSGNATEVIEVRRKRPACIGVPLQAQSGVAAACFFISRSILFGREARGDPSGRSARQALDVLVAERLEQQHCGERFLSHVA